MRNCRLSLSTLVACSKDLLIGFYVYNYYYTFLCFPTSKIQPCTSCHWTAQLKKIKVNKNDHESNKSKQPGPKTRFYKLISPLLSHFTVRLFVTPWTLAYQAPPSMEFSRQQYWSGLPYPSPGVFLTQGSNLGLLHGRWTHYPLSHQGSALAIQETQVQSLVEEDPQRRKEL